MSWSLDKKFAAVKTENGSAATFLEQVFNTGAGGAADNDEYWFIGYHTMLLTDASEEHRIVTMTMTDGITTENMTEILRVRQDITGTVGDQLIVQLFALRNSDLVTPIDVETGSNMVMRANYDASNSRLAVFNGYIVFSASAPTAGTIFDYLEGGICERDGASSESLSTTHIQALGTVDFVFAAVAIIQSSPQPVSGWNMDTDMAVDTTNVTGGGLECKAFMRMAATTPANTAINKVETGDDTNVTHLAVRFSEIALGGGGVFQVLLEADGNTTADCFESRNQAAVTRRHRGRKIFTITEAIS